MALPIFAKFIKKVYADKQLPYNEEEQFDYPEDYDPCQTHESLPQSTPDISVDLGVFD